MLAVDYHPISSGPTTYDLTLEYASLAGLRAKRECNSVSQRSLESELDV